MDHLDGTFSGLSKVFCLVSHRPKGGGAVRRMVSFKPTGLYLYKPFVTIQNGQELASIYTDF